MQSNTKPKVLAVDDEKFNLDIISRYLSRADFNVVTASDGDDAIKKLREHPDVEVIVLDRMMPKMNGLEVVKILKSNDLYKRIPIVMQTAAAQTSQVIEGIKAGVYYYLTKPYNGSLLVSIVRAALEDGFRLREVHEEINRNFDVPCLMNSVEFEFRTREEVKSLTAYLANMFQDSSSASVGLLELMMNAVEHGNLGITYDEKKKLLFESNFEQEVARRLAMYENQHKLASVFVELNGDGASIRIKDKGQGFAWDKYLQISPARATDPNGRGVAMSVASLTDVIYHGCGNEVSCFITGLRSPK